VSNNYVPNLTDLLAGELARAADINTRYGYLVSGFDKLPAPLASGQGFSDPVVVGTPTLDTHAVPKSVMDAVETGVITNRDATAVSAAAALVSETNAATSETNAASSETAAGVAQVAAETAKTAAETAETASVTAKTAAETAQTAALASQTASAASASAAALSETNAAASESSVAADAATASTAATNASASQVSATSSQAAAAASATAASASETAAASSETAAASSSTSATTAKTAAETAQAAALVSQNAAASSATSAASSVSSIGSAVTDAQTAATTAETHLDTFQDQYLGSVASDPAVDLDGDPLTSGAMAFLTSTNQMRVYNGSSWQDAGSAVNGTSSRDTFLATSGQTTFVLSGSYDVGYVDVYLNGIKLLSTTDFTATTGSSIVLTAPAALNDVIDVVAYGTFTVLQAVKNPDGGFANSTYTTAQSIDGGAASG